MDIFKYECGDEVKDSISDFKGTITARTEWLNRCVRYVVQSKKTAADGKLMDNSFDETQLT